MTYKTLKQIIGYCEITVNSNSAVMNKYKLTGAVELDYNIVEKLIRYGILVEDSANFDTGETHFVLEEKFYVDNADEILPILPPDINTDSLLHILRDKKINVIIK